MIETLTVGDFTVDLKVAFSTEQKTAIQFALQAWSAQLSAGLPIRFELGFAGAILSDGSYLVGYPSKWEEYLYYNGSTLNTMTDSGRYTAIRSTALYWDGPNAKAANGGSRIEMHAPSTYASGSSVSHWDSSVAVTTFMKYQIASGTYCRTINDREAKLLKDVGWTLTGSAAPSAPTGVSAGDGDSTASVAVSWMASSGATGYDVYRYTSASSASASLRGSDIAGTAYTDSTATPGVLYYYWVKAKNAAGSGAFSVSDSGYRALSAPTGVSATDSAPIGVSVTWSAAAEASYYRVYRAISAGGAKTALGSWQSALSYSDVTAAIGTPYYYWVAAAVDGSGTRASAYSS